MSSNNTTICHYLSAEEAEKYVYTTADTILKVAALPAISLIGILLNSAFLFTVYRVKDMRTTTNIYLENLAVADVMLLIIRLANYFGTYLYSPIDYFPTPFTSRFFCGIPFLLLNLFRFASVFFISLVAFERYMAICRPAIHRQTNSRTRAFRLSLISWIASFVTVACHSGAFRIETVCIAWPDDALDLVPIYFRTCKGSDFANYSLVIIDVFQFFLACFCNCILYVCIVRRLNQRKGRNTSRERNHVAKMLVINTCVFFTCLTPMKTTNLAYILEVDLRGYVFLWITVVATSLNSAVNPIIYNAFNPDYRMAFCRAFTCTNPTRQIPVPSVNSVRRLPLPSRVGRM